MAGDVAKTGPPPEAALIRERILARGPDASAGGTHAQGPLSRKRHVT
jgi:hypothetical protein